MVENRGSRTAAAELSDLIAATYHDLRSAARAMLRMERPGHTLQATALVHEIYLRLASRRELGLNSREDFYRIARYLMRRVLIDHARRRQRLKRSGDLIKPAAETVCEPSTFALRS